MQFYFFLVWDTSLFPRKNAPRIVLLLSSTLPAQSTSVKAFKSTIGKLQYVVHTRPDIALAVGMVAIFLANPKENHMMEIKRIMRYLKGTQDYGLW